MKESTPVPNQNFSSEQRRLLELLHDADFRAAYPDITEEYIGTLDSEGLRMLILGDSRLQNFVYSEQK